MDRFIHKSNWSKIGLLSVIATLTLLMQTGVSSAQSEDDSDPMDRSAAPSAAFRVFLKDGSTLIGEIKDGPILFNSTIGKIGLPLSKLVAIEFSDKTRAVFLNGDKLTGTVENTELGLKAKWGDVQLKVSEIQKVYAKDLPKDFKIVKARFGGSRSVVEKLVYVPDQTTNLNRTPTFSPTASPRYPSARPSPFGSVPSVPRAGSGASSLEPPATVAPKSGAIAVPSVSVPRPARTLRPRPSVDYTKDDPVSASPDARKPIEKKKSSDE